MILFFKEIYLTAFIIFFRFRGSAWSPEWNAGKSVSVLAFIEEAFLLGIVSWLEVLAGERFVPHLPKGAIAIAFVALCATNHYLLVIRGYGIRFEQEFTRFKKTKKYLLVTSCIAIIVAVITFSIYSISVFHRFFHIVPKS
ncbi:MAG TPA: hypothetical protein VG077_01215 [Verrucomicrobiae bacterium]|nr:hypothetical protein [Verrucomicrobiae bacterium]